MPEHAAGPDRGLAPCAVLQQTNVRICGRRVEPWTAQCQSSAAGIRHQEDFHVDAVRRFQIAFGDDILSLANRHETSAMHQGCLIREKHGVIGIMRGHDHGNALPGERGDQLKAECLVPEIEVRCWLVKQNDLRILS